MEITESQFEKVKHLLPRQRGNVKHDSRTLLNGMLYVLENGRKWRRRHRLARFVARL